MLASSASLRSQVARVDVAQTGSRAEEASVAREGTPRRILLSLMLEAVAVSVAVVVLRHVRQWCGTPWRRRLEPVRLRCRWVVECRWVVGRLSRVRRCLCQLDRRLLHPVPFVHPV